jgi:hypothetical protein
MSCVPMKKNPEIIFRENGGQLRKIYNVTKTLTDCFKFRNKIGMDIVLRYFYMKELINLPESFIVC